MFSVRFSPCSASLNGNFTRQTGFTKRYDNAVIQDSFICGSSSLQSVGFGAGKLRSRSENDKKYIKTLAKELGTEPKNLESVMGADELKELISSKDANPENFLPGRNDENIKSGRLDFSLHIHTLYSDGKMYPEEVLKKAAYYSHNFRNDKSVYVSITDHDNMKGCIWALKEISGNPKKYKNVRFIPGVEMSGIYETPYGGFGYRGGKDFAYFDLLAYGVNPFDQNLIDSLPRPFKARLSIDNISENMKDKNVVLALAHPATVLIEDDKEYENFLHKLKKTGLNAMEIYYPYKETGQLYVNYFRFIAEKFAKSQGLLAIGGADCHSLNIFHRNNYQLSYDLHKIGIVY